MSGRGPIATVAGFVMADVERYRVRVADIDYYRETINCQAACPVHTDAAGYVNLIADGLPEIAYLAARQPNPLALVCAQVCNAPCEAACRRGVIDAPINIRALKRFAAERYAAAVEAGAQIEDETPGNTATKESMAGLQRAGKVDRAARVAVIGSGPAGLTCAFDLCLLGYSVTIFEGAPAPGGMLTYGIPRYRLPREIVGRVVDEVTAAGAELRLNQRAGRDFSLSDLKAEGYSAIFLAVGTQSSRMLRMDGVDLPGVYGGLDFLHAASEGEEVPLGHKVIVVGGGNVAMDVARTALRANGTGAKREVHVFCLECREEMPASEEEIIDALEEGIILHPGKGPSRVLSEDGLCISGLETIDCASVFDGEGRFNPSFTTGTEETYCGDNVIIAIGQGADLGFLAEKDGVQLTPQRTIAVDPQTLATSAPGVFAGGDAVFGPRIIIDAVANGHLAARSIDAYVNGARDLEVTASMTGADPAKYLREGYLNIERRRPPLVPVEQREGMAEVELSMSSEEAKAQASRCLQCYVQTVFDGDKCVLCGGCVDVCPYYCLKMVKLDALEGREDLEALVQLRYGVSLAEFRQAGGNAQLLNLGTAMIKDETRCVRCGLCSRRCPTGAISMESFCFKEDWVAEAGNAQSRSQVPEGAGA